ncbi:hypothetical protein [Coleofasciculus chthonoplastes]
MSAVKICVRMHGCRGFQASGFPTRWENKLNGNTQVGISEIAVTQFPTRWENKLNGNADYIKVIIQVWAVSHSLGKQVEWKQLDA